MVIDPCQRILERIRIAKLPPVKKEGAHFYAPERWVENKST
jgi:hypothetical protein